ncbi:uncharacterized protein LOC106155424 [Lingula anatina]|uniref:Uncharacterized protein LOC106155421 n=1 Tax=Lingula anatina TaxID=7574 RepID=A0A1S3HL53_LINAN|nr:uncharacterized protein LOC106155421 [Lingula anatina]XP_013385739.1 uncharacterized protein LOC106155424 [Lingula anatina]|eukprot:XP_013385724.1 uncharacterized protein LOC106155421 [Lingula anatina]
MVDFGGLHHWEISAIAIGLFCLAILAVIYGVWLYLDYKKRLFLARAKFLYQNGKAGSTMNRSLVPKEGPEGTEMRTMPRVPQLPPGFVGIPDEFVVVEGPKGEQIFARAEAVNYREERFIARMLYPVSNDENLFTVSNDVDLLPFVRIITKAVDAVRRGDKFQLVLPEVPEIPDYMSEANYPSRGDNMSMTSDALIGRDSPV